MRFVIINILLVISCCVFANNDSNQLDSLLRELDRTVEFKDDYAMQKEQLIATLKREISNGSTEEQLFKLTENLFVLYSNYQVDSAFHIAKERVALGNKIDKPEFIAEANLNLAEALRTTGMYKESLELLDKIGEQDLAKYNRPYYTHLYHSLYILMNEYSISERDRQVYNAMVFSYKDSILAITPTTDISYFLVSSTKNIMLGEYDIALKIALQAYQMDEQNPMVNYTLASIYNRKGDVEKQKIHLAMSAIADLKGGAREYLSLQELAQVLFQEGDIDRGYNYMMTSMDDAIFSNARLRALEISRMLPIINAAHDIKMSKERARLIWITVVAAILVLILLVGSLYVYRQVKTLSSIRKYQKKINTELKLVNEELNLANSELVDANLIKEEYIGYVFNICSSYIDKLEEYRVMVNRRIMAGQVSELKQITSSSTLVSDELKEFYKNFDAIFLNMYPTFIEDFNDLLEDDGEIIPKDGDLLTPELRIFALVRLGINDSVKIADFLHYSPQTIYNYRLKIRNKIKVPKDEFSSYLLKIGLRKQ